MTNNIWFPYENLDETEFSKRTEELITMFPINMSTIVDIVLESWDDIFTVTNENGDFNIGKTIFPKPQMMGFFLESLINQKIKKIDPKTWVPDPSGFAKDIANINNERFSLEIKTSSNPKHIYGNRSYGQRGESAKKSKDGYYLAVNFEKFNKENPTKKPNIKMIRFGYLNFTDWVAQKKETGQQAYIPAHIESKKLITIWENNQQGKSV